MNSVIQYLRYRAFQNERLRLASENLTTSDTTDFDTFDDEMKVVEQRLLKDYRKSLKQEDIN